MPRKYDKKLSTNQKQVQEFKPLNEEQRIAYEAYKQNDIIFMTGPAGVGKTFLAATFAIQDILRREKSKIIMSRPIIEAGENLGFLPGDMDEKVYPYMLPLYDCIDKICGKDNDSRRLINENYELAPLAYLRGRNFDNCVCILDEAQNCTKPQLKLFLTRLGKFSKMIVSGDLSQTDLPRNQSGLEEVVEKCKDIEGIAHIHFSEEAIVRHRLVAEIVKRI